MTDFEIPESMQPAADPRRLAAELDYTYFLMLCRDGLITEEMETDYVVRTADDFTADKAAEIVGEFVGWYIEDPDNGLAAAADQPMTRSLLEQLSGNARNLAGRNVSALRNIERAFRQLHLAYGLLNDNMGGPDSAEATHDIGVIHAARFICDGLVDAESQGLKEAVMRSQKNEVLRRKLGAVLGLA